MTTEVRLQLIESNQQTLLDAISNLNTADSTTCLTGSLDQCQVFDTMYIYPLVLIAIAYNKSQLVIIILVAIALFVVSLSYSNIGGVGLAAVRAELRHEQPDHLVGVPVVFPIGYEEFDAILEDADLADHADDTEYH